MNRSAAVVNIDTLVAVSYGGPRNDRYFNVVFPATMDFQLHVYRSYQKIIYDEKNKVKSVTYIARATGEEIAYASKRGILFFSSVGALWFNPETVGFDMLGNNPNV